MNTNDNLYGPVVVGLAGVTATNSELQLLSNPLVGGVLLFSRNFESAAQITELCGVIHSVRTPPLLIWVDQEGGRIQRFRGESFTDLPPCSALGELYDDDAGLAVKLSYDTGWLMAAELRLCGIDSSLAPVVDTGGGNDTVIGNRALHGKADAIAELAVAYMRGMSAAGMAGMAKHFPGHGAVAGDTHVAACIDPRPLVEIMQNDLQPYKVLMKHGLLRAVMISHVTYPEVSLEPAGYSGTWLRDILRRQLGFTGLVVSDDLGMAAAAVLDNVVDRAEASLLAGCDMLIVSESEDMAATVLSHLAAHTFVDKSLIDGLRGAPIGGYEQVQRHREEVRRRMQQHGLLP